MGFNFLHNKQGKISDGHYPVEMLLLCQMPEFNCYPGVVKHTFLGAATFVWADLIKPPQQHLQFLNAKEGTALLKRRPIQRDGLDKKLKTLSV